MSLRILGGLRPMIGFMFGAACLYGLLRTVRGGGGRGRHYFQGRGGFGTRAGLRYLFERLDTSPGQEKVIFAAASDLFRHKREIVSEFEQTRHAVAQAMRGEVFDEAALDAAFARQDALLAALRGATKSALSSVHEALDERQRKVFADLLERGFHFGRRGRCGGDFAGRYSDEVPFQGPYRDARI